MEEVKRACKLLVIQYSTGHESFHIAFLQDTFVKFSAITISLYLSCCFNDSWVLFGFSRESLPTPWQQCWAVWCQCAHDARSSTHWRIWASMHLPLSSPQSRSDTATAQPKDSPQRGIVYTQVWAFHKLLRVSFSNSDGWMDGWMEYLSGPWGKLCHISTR